MAKAAMVATVAEPRDTPLVVAVFNQKGGVGKTTTAVNLAAVAARPPFNRRVLLIDFDPQAHATFHSGLPRSSEDEQSAVNAMLLGKGEATSIEALAVGTEFYDCLPGGLDVQDADMALSAKQITSANAGKSFNAGAVFARRVAEISPGRWDLIVIDCPPDLSVITVNALNAATGVVIPLLFEYASLVGIADLGNSISMAQQVNPKLQVAAVVGVKTERKTLHSEAMKTATKSLYPDAFVEDPIRKDVQLAEALGDQKPITHYAAKSKGAKDYRKLADLLAARGAI